MQPELDLALAFMESHPEEAAQSLERLPVEEASEILAGVPSETAAHVITRMQPYIGAQCLSGLPSTVAGELLAVLPRDHSALLLRRMDEANRENLLRAAPAPVSAGLSLLLRHPVNTAGALMNPQVLSLPRDITAGEALERVRRPGERIAYYIYVIDREGKLTGVINLRELIEAPEHKTLEEVMHVHVERLSVHADSVTMLASSGWLDYYALPVVDDHNVLVGMLRYKTLRAVCASDSERAGVLNPLDAGLALGELYWSTLGELLQTLWRPAPTPVAPPSEKPHER